jgi:3-dehydroquinate synthase
MSLSDSANNSAYILDFGAIQTRIEFIHDSRNVSDHVDGKILVVCDENTKAFVPNTVIDPVILASGESHKRLSSVQRILEAALEADMGRDDCIIGIGGGVICDISAFAASIYMRGCKLSLVPTTLLSMVDAAMGGKTGVDFGGAKNIVGTFYPAEIVYICVPVLDSLSDREYVSGLAEGIKHALLADPELFDMFQACYEAVRSRETSCIEEIIKSSIRVKGDIVEADLRESGVRAHLNYGHTFGHALEAATGYSRVTHGEAVAWGIGKALKLGLRLGITDSEYAAAVWELLVRYGYRLRGIEFSEDMVIDYMKADKKRIAGKLRFIVQENLGITRIVQADDTQVRAVLSDDSAIE